MRNPSEKTALLQVISAVLFYLPTFGLAVTKILRDVVVSLPDGRLCFGS